jgi:tRNA(fMet)-specific endonuclease VapC
VIEPRYLIDTNICIDVLADADSSAARRLGGCVPGSAVVSAITFAEVLLGVARGSAKEVATARALFELVPVVPFDETAAAAYARLPFRRGSFDRLIASHALSLGLTLVTNNPRDFADVPDVRVENWAQP